MNKEIEKTIFPSLCIFDAKISILNIQQEIELLEVVYNNFEERNKIKKK